ncbi:structural protein P5 [Pseudoxanthomonas winnipegensis]|uniref:structural protein P5 n=1 Tax=Pseudoxanthomonas winnipegensis TaxID=2480810 RepID=UPI00102D9E53|nr:structural protein P5 [Pseudoxanthomonas winnipegensis]RZZ81947.1 structural protein P5 [Pseudoxanthomonas winnipegensis]
MTAPRGVRNNNPGNLDRNPDVIWQGEDRSEGALAREKRFCVFLTPEYGFRALVRTLVTYQDKHKLRTVDQMIRRWAPPSENDTTAYVRQVASALGVAPDRPLDIHAPETAFQFAKAIARHENGGNFWGDQVIRDGVELAGVRA